MVEVIGTDIELLVIAWLDRRKIIYEFKSSLMGGFFALGGAVVDILLRERNLAWRIFGEYWHQGVIKEGSDQIQRELLTNLGYTVVDIWGDDILDPTRINETLTKALLGQEMLK